jgi:hypothetical protein
MLIKALLKIKSLVMVVSVGTVKQFNFPECDKLNLGLEQKMIL